MTPRLARHLDRRFWLYAALIGILSLWLRDGLPLWVIADAGHDDQLFLRQANAILQGQWLGTYDWVTHAKPPFYSIFIAIVFVLSVPLKIAEHTAYLITGLCLAHYIGQRAQAKAIGLACFAMIAFCPVLWHPELQRVIREGLYMPQTLGVFALAAYCFLAPGRTGWRRWLVLLFFGLFFAGFWITREEGIWLIPSLVLLAISGIIIDWHAMGRTPGTLWGIAKRQVLNVSLMVVVMIMGVMSVGALNWAYYDSFRINDFQTRDFAAAYGAITRVDDPSAILLVPASRDTLDLIYAASPAAAELAPHLRGEVGKFWGEVGCEVRPIPGCEQILSGWFQWALRDAAAAAGHYASAPDASRYFKQLANEINKACDDAMLDCGPRRNTMMPRFTSDLIDPLLSALWDSTVLSAKQRDHQFGSMPTIGHPENRALFADMTGHDVETNPDIADPTTKRPRHDVFNAIRQDMARWITNAQRVIVALSLLTAVIGSVVIAFSRTRWRLINWHLAALTLALGGAVAARIVLLSFVHVTAQPAINVLYFSPSIVLVPALAMCWLAALAPAFRKTT
ncbi:MAG: hypothetical protein AAF213_10110 [Pseudomonadota bacterium]